MRKIVEYKAADGRKAVVWFDYENNEYRVKFYNHQGVHMDASDYFTDDREDAINTAKFETARSTPLIAR